MQNILVHLPYFGSIVQFREMLRPGIVLIENEDNYQKQTYRNRMNIYGANGKLLLNIPIKHLHLPGVKQHQKYKDVKIEKEATWQKQHWKSLQSAYKTSPFFEFYEDDLAPLYHKEFDFLMDFNYACFEALKECLQLDIHHEKTLEFLRNPENIIDKRDLINAKQHIEIPKYTQVFQEKHGFISNLCILDLLFNEGPNSINYLESLP